MNGVKDKIWFLREGLFAKYVIALAYFRDQQPYMSIAVAHSGFNAGVTVAEIDLHFLSDFLGDAQVGKATFAYVVSAKGEVIATSAKGPDLGNDLSGLPQVAAL